ncbi:hypothetical protein BD310DRAFT_953204 [Dichomitus squalens]|uniref:Uncharacterized protein n=1 Tax=Dichomitus squalens TaxID=114155 RepID=A0A4Q9PEQ9_9APHY|nr:hypothetical protein BD310DRAFT_953204 [Dichomitus squalens]
MGLPERGSGSLGDPLHREPGPIETFQRVSPVAISTIRTLSGAREPMNASRGKLVEKSGMLPLSGVLSK